MACEKQNIDILGNLDVDIDAESQAAAEQIFAQAIGQLATQDPKEIVKQVSKGNEQDIQAQQELVARGFSPLIAAQFAAELIHHHFASHEQQFEQSQ